MTKSAEFSGLAGGESFVPDEDEAGVFASEHEDDEASALPGAGGDDETFASASEDEGGTSFFVGRNDEVFSSASEDGGDSFFASERGDEGAVCAGGPREADYRAPFGDGKESGGRSRFLGVRLRRAGQVFFFPDDDLPARAGSKVIVGFEQSTVFGEVETVLFSDASIPAGATEDQGAGRILGLATAQDIALHAENRILTNEATAFCATCIRQRSLDMKLVDVEVLHDRSKIIFYFTAPARIDFRELVKDLVRNYRTRIELRQIGVRHETQMIGGIGNCGMVCCCHQYLRKFAPVTIKMAKEQNLFLNPAKLSGMCGRLLCCLSFEQSNYEEFNRRCPKLGKRYATESGTFRIMRVNMFSRSIVVCSDAGEEKELALDEWEAIRPRRAETPAPDTRGSSQPRRFSGEDGRKGRFRGREDKAGRSDPDGPDSSGGIGAAASVADSSRRPGQESGGNALAAEEGVAEEEILS